MKDLPDTIEELQRELSNHARYICDNELATVLFLAFRMGKPILIEGPAGVGKTEVAKAVSRLLECELIRLQCYEGLDESRALYEWEYGKQLLFTQILREKIHDLYSDTDSLSAAMERLEEEEAVFFRESFLLERPLLAAIRAKERPVLLIDEIDKSDQEFEAFLLELLSDFQVTIPEIGTLTARQRPIVILTSNQVRELSEALKRRCLYFYIDYPSPEREREIIRLHLPDIEEELNAAVVQVVNRVRTLDLKKKPSVSESIEWAQALLMLGATEINETLLRETLGTLIKHRNDQQKVRDKATTLLN